MSVSIEDIGLMLSGGRHNFNPNLSLGGEISSYPVVIGKNNLFSDVGEDDANDGVIDYRCMYIINNHATDTTLLTLAIAEQINEITSIGIVEETEVQRIHVRGAVSGGSVDLNYGVDTITVAWNADPDVWASNLETELNTITELAGTTAIASYSSSEEVIFTITFPAAHAIELLSLDSNDLTGSPELVFTRLFVGNPINSEAQELENDTQEPSGVSFTDEIVITSLAAGEYFPFWIKRDVPNGIDRTSPDGFVLSVYLGSGHGAYSIAFGSAFE